MCTDFKIIATNHHDGTRTDFTAWLWAATECQRFIQVFTNDGSSAFTAFETNMLMD
jgi:hypothetical protein